MMAMLVKAAESLEASRACLAQGYPNSAVSRAYYAMFQAAQAAVAHVASRQGPWSHKGMQAAVVNELIRRRKLCRPELARHLAEALALRGVADYHARDVSPS